MWYTGVLDVAGIYLNREKFAERATKEAKISARNSAKSSGSRSPFVGSFEESIVLN